MSDDGFVNLEDESAPPVADPAPAPPAPEPVAAVAPPAEEDDAIDVAGQKVVPLAALQSARAEARALKEQAARAADLEAQVRELAPYAEFLKNNRDLLIQRQPEPVAPPPAEVDQDAVEMAQLLDFYKPDGSLDVEKGKRALALQERRASKIADQRVAPIIKRTAEEQAQMNYQRAAQVKDADGQTASPEALQAIFRQMSPELAADPAVAQILTLAALGADRMRTPRKAVVAPPLTAPALSEPSGGHPQSRPTMSRFEESIARERGVSAQRWQENTKGFTPGRTSSLED